MEGTGNPVLFLSQHCSATGPVCRWFTLKCGFCPSRKTAIYWIFLLRYLNAITEEALTSPRVISACIMQFLPLCLWHRGRLALPSLFGSVPTAHGDAGIAFSRFILLASTPRLSFTWWWWSPTLLQFPWQAGSNILFRAALAIPDIPCLPVGEEPFTFSLQSVLLGTKEGKWTMGFCQQVGAARSFEGHAATAGKTQTCEWNKPQGNNEF